MWIHKVFAPIKAFTPRWTSGPAWAIGRAFMAPIAWSIRSGHFRKLLAMRAVSRSGAPLLC
jgi:hypothetical protein